MTTRVTTYLEIVNRNVNSTQDIMKDYINRSHWLKNFRKGTKVLPPVWNVQVDVDLTIKLWRQLMDATKSHK